jgi:hypothetical protein
MDSWGIREKLCKSCESVQNSINHEYLDNRWFLHFLNSIQYVVSFIVFRSLTLLTKIIRLINKSQKRKEKIPAYEILVRFKLLKVKWSKRTCTKTCLMCVWLSTEVEGVLAWRGIWARFWRYIDSTWTITSINAIIIKLKSKLFYTA